jgi:hypothetical protein
MNIHNAFRGLFLRISISSANNESDFSLHKKQCKEKDLTEDQSD